MAGFRSIVNNSQSPQMRLSAKGTSLRLCRHPQFDAAPAQLNSFGQRFRFLQCLKRFGGTTSKMQGFRLIRAYYPTPSPVQSLPPWPLGKRRSRRKATRSGPFGTDNRLGARLPLRPETGRVQSARSGHLVARFVALTRNRPESKA